MIEVCQSDQKLDLPDGEYKGNWSGWEVELENVGWHGFSFHVNVGVRCPFCPVSITVKDGVAHVFKGA